MSDTPGGATRAGRDRAPADRTATADGRAPSTFLNALVGAAVSVVLSVLPFSTVGGGVAGYLQGGDYGDGARVGALAGVVAFVPFVAIFGLVLAFVALTTFLAPGVQATLWVSVAIVLSLAVVYTVGLGAVGGVLGAYVKREF